MTAMMDTTYCALTRQLRERLGEEQLFYALTSDSWSNKNHDKSFLRCGLSE